MPAPQLTFVSPGYADPRRVYRDSDPRNVSGPTVFTANASGTTTTIVGANAAPGTNDNNVIRRGEKFKLFTSAGVLKQETVFEVTAIAVGASTTVTFTPAASGATASGDFARLVGSHGLDSMADIDARLTALDAGRYTTTQLMRMSLNDKLYQLRVLDDPKSLKQGP